MELLWRRALASSGEKLHCLVNGDLLDYDVSQKVVDCLHTLMKEYSDIDSHSIESKSVLNFFVLGQGSCL